MVNLDLECRLAAQRIQELRRRAAEMQRLRAATTSHAAERDPGRVVQLRRAPDVRPERT